MGICFSYSMILRNNSRSAYLTLKNDSLSPFNTVSSMMNVFAMPFFGNMNYIQLGSSHAILYLSVGYKGELYHNMMK